MEHSPSQAHHPDPKFYLAIFGWLAVMTVIEVATAPMIFLGNLRIAVLVSLAIVKALLVALFYMHLRYDSRWYILILIVGLFFAVLFGRLVVTFVQ